MSDELNDIIDTLVFERVAAQKRWVTSRELRMRTLYPDAKALSLKRLVASGRLVSRKPQWCAKQYATAEFAAELNARDESARQAQEERRQRRLASEERCRDLRGRLLRFCGEPPVEPGELGIDLTSAQVTKLLELLERES